MEDDWEPWTLRTSTRPSREFAWPTGSVIPKDVDDQAPIPLLVSIGLLLIVGFVIIVVCICRRHNLLGGSSSQQSSSATYQRAPMGEGLGVGGHVMGVGANSYPMAPVKSMYPPMAGPQAMVGLPGKPLGGGTLLGPPHLQQGQLPHPPPHPHPHLQHPVYPSPLPPPDAYSPPYPMGYAPLPAYMPTSQSSHTSSASGPSSDQGPSGFSSSSPPAPAPAPSAGGEGVAMTSEVNMDQSECEGYAGQQGQDDPDEETDSGTVSGCGFNPPGMVYTGQGPCGYPGMQGQRLGFQMTLTGGNGGSEVRGQVGTPGSYTTTPFHSAVRDYMAGGGGGGMIPRVGSPMPPPGTVMTELDQL